MTPEEQSTIDQMFAMLAESWPPALYRFYANCINEGFDKDQALMLTITIFKALLGQTK